MKTPTQIITTNTDEDADGIVDSRVSDTYTYDRRGNLLTEVSETDNDGDGSIDFRDSNTYDQRGNQLTSVFEYDNNADGTIDYRQETLYEYLNGSEYLIGVFTPELEVFADNSIDSQVNPLSEQFDLPLTVAEF